MRSRAEGFGAEVKRRILIGTYALSAGYFDAYYLRAQRVRRLIANDFAEAFEQVDLIAGPTAPTVAFKLGEKADDPLAMYAADVNTVARESRGSAGDLRFPRGFSARPAGRAATASRRPSPKRACSSAAHQFQQRHRLARSACR